MWKSLRKTHILSMQVAAAHPSPGTPRQWRGLPVQSLSQNLPDLPALSWLPDKCFYYIVMFDERLIDVFD